MPKATVKTTLVLQLEAQCGHGGRAGKSHDGLDLNANADGSLWAHELVRLFGVLYSTPTSNIWTDCPSLGLGQSDLSAWSESRANARHGGSKFLLLNPWGHDARMITYD